MCVSTSITLGVISKEICSKLVLGYLPLQVRQGDKRCNEGGYLSIYGSLRLHLRFVKYSTLWFSSVKLLLLQAHNTIVSVFLEAWKIQFSSRGLKIKPSYSIRTIRTVMWQCKKVFLLIIYI